jgi:hypothetical protein
MLLVNSYLEDQEGDGRMPLKWILVRIRSEWHFLGVMSDFSTSNVGILGGTSEI